MKKLLGSAMIVIAMVSAAAAKGPKDQWIDGSVTYKVPGVDTHFTAAGDACKASADDLTKHGNKKTSDGTFKDGTSSTTLTCVLKESDGTVFEQTNIISKILECPDTSSPRSTDNSGEFSKMRCHCDDAKKGCPKPAAAPKK